MADYNVVRLPKLLGRRLVRRASALAKAFKGR